nr:hypothetical protein [Trochiscia hystrix]
MRKKKTKKIHRKKRLRLFKSALAESFHKLGSSETTRKAPSRLRNKINKRPAFAFHNYLKNMPQHIKIKKIDLYLSFLEWFIGFAEGDGSFVIRKDRSRISFELAQKDPQVLYFIKKKLGFGKVNSIKEKECSVYRVDNLKNIKRIVYLFNGNLVLPKRRFQFYHWMKLAQTFIKFPPYVKNKQKNLFQGPQVSDKTAWLSGFIDAEGCFFASFSTPSPRSQQIYSFKQKMLITQKSVYDDYKILQQIGKVFLSKAKVQCFSNKKNLQKLYYYRIEISSLLSHKLVRNYLLRFPQRTIKIRAFKRWERVLSAREKGNHLDCRRIPKLQKLCQDINK